jgi:4'-phosphopantetheinyl transferase
MPLHSVRPLPGGAHLGLWHLTETPTELWAQLAGADAYRPLLPARADGLRQAQWLAGRVLVQHTLQAAGLAAVPPLPQLHNEATGRPYLVGAHKVPAVSLSHSGAWVAVLLAPPNTPVGIDVEVVRDKALRIARKFLNATELAATEGLALLDYAPSLLGTAPTPASTEVFSLLWSAKETLYKLAGQRGIIFRENLLLDLPAGPWPATGELPAQLALNGSVSRHQICYFRPEPGYVLTYCYSVPSPT